MSCGTSDLCCDDRDANGTYITSYPNGPWWSAYYGSAWNKPDKVIGKLEAKGATNWGDFPLFASTPGIAPSLHLAQSYMSCCRLGTSNVSLSRPVRRICRKQHQQVRHPLRNGDASAPAHELGHHLEVDTVTVLLLCKIIVLSNTTARKHKPTRGA